MSLLDTIWIHLLLGCLTGYLTGAIPFGYLVYRWTTGTDIRTVGSGNIGATNVGRLLGFRYFLLVFALDVLKGFVPVLGVPLALKTLGLSPPADLPLVVAMAAILGHNFPVYLGFKGGKGVATSLGTLLALDPISCAAAAVGFFAVFFLTRYVSLSSIAGAMGFVAGHFLRIKDPWNRSNIALSILSIVIAVLIIVRHHKNIGRIFQGTEPRVPLRRARAKEEQPMKPSGRIHIWFLAVLVVLTAAVLGVLSWVIQHARAPIMVTAGPWTLRETHRELTGQQRSTHVLFAENGKTLAVMCPRYNKVLLYKVTDRASLQQTAEIALEGRPLAFAMAAHRLVILQRPPGDDKHLTPGWWEAFQLDGSPTGLRVSAGFYPDDLAVTSDGRYLLVLNSGQAEGDKQKPLPGIDIYDVAKTLESKQPAPVGHLDLERQDDADRLMLSGLGRRALVTLPKATQMIAVDLLRPEAPRIVGRMAMPQTGKPYLSVDENGDWMVMPTKQESESVVINHFQSIDCFGLPTPWNGYLLYTLPGESALELAQAPPRFALGRFPIKGPLNLGGSRPSGLAFCPERGLAAITTKPGTVHLVSIRSRIDSRQEPRQDRMATTGDATRR